jgi:hypothetical protein
MLAFRSNDSSFCYGIEKISFQDKFDNDVVRDICLRDVAVKIADPEICLSIVDEVQQKLCFALSSQDSDICEETVLMENELTDYCYKRVAELTLNE